MHKQVYIEVHGERVLAGTITPETQANMVDCITLQPVVKFDAVSAFGGDYQFWAEKSAEFWLKTRATVRS